MSLTDRTAEFNTKLEGLMGQAMKAIGKNEHGENTGRPVFPGFELPQGLAQQVDTAIEASARADFDTAGRILDDEAKHLVAVQVTHLRSRGFDFLYNLAQKLVSAKTGKEKIDWAYGLVNPFVEQFQKGWIQDIDTASKKYWELVESLETAMRQHEEAQKKQRDETKRQQEIRDNAARREQAERLRENANELRGRWSGLLTGTAA